MKKRIFTGIALAGAAALSVSMAGCGAGATKQAEVLTKDTLLDKALDTFTNMRSMDADISMDMAVKMSASGFSMEMENKMDMNAAGTKDGNSHLTGKSHISALGQEREINMESYTVREGNELTQYSRMGEGSNEGSWSYVKTTADAVDAADTVSEMSVSQIADMYSKLKDSFSDLTLHEEKVRYNNVECYLMDGTIKGEKLAQTMQSTNQEVTEESLKSMQLMDLGASLYFRADDEAPYAVEIDLGKAIEDMLAAQSDQMQGMEISAEEMKVGVIFNSFNNVNEIKVPDAVKNSAVESADISDVLDIQNFMGLSDI